jgi:hypothetical protein
MRTAALAVALIATMAAQAPQAAPPKPAGGGSPAYQRAAQLPARIMDFKAQPANIQPGQSAMLIWSTENPTGVTIEPGLGRVTPRGSRQLTPKATTTYTLTVRGPNNQVETRTVTLNVAGTTPVAVTAGTEPAKRDIPRMPDGKPDLSGIYDFARLAPGAAGGPGARGAANPGAAPAGPALKPGAEKYRIVRGPTDAGATANCMPLIGPQSFGVPYQFQIVQSANHVAILHEYPGVFRVIPTNGAAHPVDPDPTWMGDSVGRWDGDTLVVDTIGFNEKTEINGFKHTEALHLVEKFSRPQADSLQYEVTIEDPNVFEKPWTITRGFALRTDLAKIGEFVCENNPDYSKYFEKK